MTRRIGFTGTRRGMTEDQRRVVGELLGAVSPRRVIGLHGDCIGADADFDAICRAHGIETECRPCLAPDALRARVATPIAGPVRPMERNRAIVADAAVMIACPPNFERITSGSGTWATIGFAQRARKPLIVVYPDGRIDGRMGAGHIPMAPCAAVAILLSALDTDPHAAGPGAREPPDTMADGRLIGAAVTQAGADRPAGGSPRARDDVPDGDGGAPSAPGGQPAKGGGDR